MSSPSKINVMHLRSCRGGGGGPEKTILFSAKEVDRREFEMSIAYLKSKVDPDFDLDRRAAKLGVDDFITIDERYKFDIGAMRVLLGHLRERRIDILHCHCYKSDLYGLILSRYHKMKLVTTAHGPLASWQYFWASKNWRVRYLYDQLDLRLLKYYDQVILVSDTMRPIVSRFGVAPERLIWVRNAIDSQFFRRSGRAASELRSQWNIPTDATVIGAVGRLNGEKDYPNFLEAARLLLSRVPAAHFVIAGKGELEQDLRRQVQQLGISERVHFLGHFHDVRSLYEMMDVYVLSSTREGLPNTVLEAMAMETPIVSTDVDGVREAVTAGSEAILVPARDSAKLAGGIEKMLTDGELRRRLVENARRKIENEFSFARRMRKIESIYRKVMNRPESPVGGEMGNGSLECSREDQPANDMMCARV
jgi:glycosyltransferase involved in cell wall biosynthesis